MKKTLLIAIDILEKINSKLPDPVGQQEFLYVRNNLSKIATVENDINKIATLLNEPNNLEQLKIVNKALIELHLRISDLTWHLDNVHDLVTQTIRHTPD